MMGRSAVQLKAYLQKGKKKPVCQTSVSCTKEETYGKQCNHEA